MIEGPKSRLSEANMESVRGNVVGESTLRRSSLLRPASESRERPRVTPMGPHVSNKESSEDEPDDGTNCCMVWDREMSW